MFDIGFSELLLVMVIGLVVLGPERLPVAVKTVAGWIRAMRTLATSVQNELSQELKLHELQESLKKMDQVDLQNLSPELKSTMDELKQAAEALQRPISLTADELTASSAINDDTQQDDEALHDQFIEQNLAEHDVTKHCVAATVELAASSGWVNELQEKAITGKVLTESAASSQSPDK